MTKMNEGNIASCDEMTRAVAEAEADFILAVQSEIQKLLNSKGLRARDLAKRLDVTEARVSQMFGDQAKNLTLRTIARIFHHLGETAFITTYEEYARTVAAARGDDVPQEQRWTVNGIVDDLQVAPNIAVGHATASFDLAPASAGLNQWARAEEAEAFKSRRYATAR